MPIRHITFAAALILLLFGCRGDELNLKMQIEDSGGLQPGDAVAVGDRTAGTVTAVEAAGQGGYLAQLAIAPELAAEVNRGARFVVDEDPGRPGRQRVEILPAKAGGAPLADGDTVRGEMKQAPLFPLEEMLRGFAEGLGILRDQVERFESDIRRAPESEEMQKLRDEWVRLLDEMQRAQAATEESIARDLLPRLQRELRELEDKLRALEAKPGKKPQTI